MPPAMSATMTSMPKRTSTFLQSFVSVIP
jgi:hypothetical protein